MKNQIFKQNRDECLVSWAFLAGILLYMVIRFGFLYLSLQRNLTKNIHQTKKKQIILLLGIDEILMLSTILFGCTFYSIRKRYFQNKKILTGLLMTNFTLLLISWLLIVVETGRLIYPINGLSVVIGDNLQTTLAEIYATWHLCDILLGLFIISWSGLLPHPLWKYSGVIIGLMQILCTYFGQGIKPIPLSMAIILSTIWLLKRWQHF